MDIDKKPPTPPSSVTESHHTQPVDSETQMPQATKAAKWQRFKLFHLPQPVKRLLKNLHMFKRLLSILTGNKERKIEHATVETPALSGGNDHQPEAVESEHVEARFDAERLNPSRHAPRPGGVKAYMVNRSFGEIYPGNGLPDSQQRLFQKPHLIMMRGAAAYHHLLLMCQDPATGDKIYTQINNIVGYPEFMNELQFQEYCEKEGHGVMQEFPIPIKNPEAMFKKAQKLSKKKWVHRILRHNCGTYALNPA